MVDNWSETAVIHRKKMDSKIYKNIEVYFLICHAENMKY